MSFQAPYEFKVSGREVVVQHSHNGHIRVSPNNLGYADGGGGTGQFARWRVILEGGNHCRLQSVKTGKYIRIWRGGKEIDVSGGTGPFTKFRFHYHSRPNGIKLESDRFPGRYIAVNPNKTMKIGSGGHHCNLWVKREGGGGGHHHHAHVQVVQQPQVRVVQQPSVGQASGSFGLPYHFKQNNVVVIRSNYGKNLRVSPNNTYAADGNGGQGKYAQWRVILDGGGVIKLQNTHTNKYLRIESNNAVNVGGTGGQWTRFRYHVYSHPHGVKLESCKLPGRYVAIRPNGLVCHGTGGIHTQLTFWKQGQVNIVQQPQVVQPTVIYQQQPPPQPTVIVQSPNYAQQQQQQQQQAALQQQQAVQQQMAAQQASMQQQMEQMRLQNEASLNAQRQQMEFQKQQMEAQLAAEKAEVERQKMVLEQQQANLSQTSLSPHANSPHNEGISNTFAPPVNPYYGGSGNNIVDEPPAYPVLIQPQPVQQQGQQQYAEPPEDNKEVEQSMPSKGQDAANEVLTWLTKLNMQRYYQTFIDNGYDQLETVGQISKDDLKEMGVALGHIKIIMASCINAPFANKRVRLKSVNHNTYIHEYGAPRDASGGKRCVLQHNDKKTNPGTVWMFEVVEDQVFRLKHQATNTWMRVKKDNTNGTDTRSPLGGFSDLVLEKHEKDKGVFYIKEVKQELYVRCERPRSLGRNLVSFTSEKMPECRIQIQVVRD